MRKLLTYCILFLFITGCVNKGSIGTIKNSPSPKEVVSFDAVDIDEDGTISEKEFHRAKTNSSINYKDPMWAIYSILGMVGLLLILSNLLQLKRKNKNV